MIYLYWPLLQSEGNLRDLVSSVVYIKLNLVIGLHLSLNKVIVEHAYVYEEK